MITQERDPARAAWLDQRRSGIGSSDAAALCLPWGSPGVYSTPLKVYLSKLGLATEQDSKPMKWGRLLEDAVACAFAEETGLQTARSPGLLRHPRHSWMLATPDRMVPSVNAVLEVKTADSRHAAQWGPMGSDMIPQGYHVQVLHQIEVTGADRGFLAVLIGGSDFRWYSIPRHEQSIRQLVAIEEGFWERFVRCEPPPEDWSHPDTARMVELLNRPSDCSPVVELGGEGLAHVEMWQDLGKQINYLSRERDRAKASLAKLMGASARGTLPDGRTVERKIVEIKAQHRDASRQSRLYIKGGNRDDTDDRD